MNTVSKAYRDLVVMGLLYTRRGMGVFVSKDIEDRCRQDSRRRVLIRLNEVVNEARAAGFSDKDVVDIAKKVLKLKSNPYDTMAPELTAYVGKRK